MAEDGPIALSVLDQSPIASGRSAADALAETLELARLAERLGYARYWLAEHHNTGGLAGTAPEVLIARVASVTERIRVGSGGVMLSHYSPLKVAEAFRVLHTLFPGRIDLGVGRAPGSDRRTALALSTGMPMPLERFPEQLRDLAGFLTDGLPEGHPDRGIRAMPQGPGAPEIWLLGSSAQSAAYAAHFGFAFSFAHFINPDDGIQVMEGYRRYFRPSGCEAEPRGSVAVRVMCADTDEEARLHASSFALMRLRMERGQIGPVPSVEEAQAYPYSPLERERLAEIVGRAVVGDPLSVKARLEQMAADFGVRELVIVTVCHDAAARRRSYELLAEAFRSRELGVGVRGGAPVGGHSGE